MLRYLFIILFNISLLYSTQQEFHLAEQPIGLINPGNNCFANSALQCLYHIKPMTNAFLADNKKALDCYKKGSISELYIQFLEDYSKATAPFSPNAVCQESQTNLGQTVGGQGDASEFARHIINSLKDDDLTEQCKKNNSIQKLLFELFSIKSIQQIATKNAKCPRIHKDQTPSISWELPNKKTLQESIEQYFAPETLLYTCYYVDKETRKEVDAEAQNRDPILVDASNEIKLTHTSPYLFIQLASKVAAIPFALTDLDLAPYFIKDSKQKITKYDLVSFIMHQGSQSSGHYTAYVKGYDQNWYYCNDSSISLINQTEIEAIAQKGENNGFYPAAFFYKQQNESETPKAPEKLDLAIPLGMQRENLALLNLKLINLRQR